MFSLGKGFLQLYHESTETIYGHGMYKLQEYDQLFSIS